jgi:hypothetical protein
MLLSKAHNAQHSASAHSASCNSYALRYALQHNNAAANNMQQLVDSML